MKLAFAVGPDNGLMSKDREGQVTVWGNDLDKYHPKACNAFGGPFWIEFPTKGDARKWAAEAGFALVAIPGDWDSLTLAQCLRFASGKLDGGGILEPWGKDLD